MADALYNTLTLSTAWSLFHIRDVSVAGSIRVFQWLVFIKLQISYIHFKIN
jgi:hypothetical protein